MKEIDSLQTDNTRRVSVTPTVIIGLGGTGQKVLARLKTLVQQSLPAEIPIVRYLCFDTDLLDEGEAKDYSLFSSTEIHQLTVEDIQGLLANKEKHPAIFEWFPHDMEASKITRGANQQRLLGRLSLFWNLSQILGTLEDALKTVGNLRNRTITRNLGYTVLDGLNVILVSSTCGGTGSGMVLDMAYLIRHFYRQADLVGMLLLPSAFHIEQQESIDANGFAMLEELEHFNRTRAFSQNYGSLSINIEGYRPFDRVYLLDAWNEKERHLDTMENVCQMTAEAIFAKSCQGIHEKHRSIVDNIQHHFNRELPDMNGRTAACSSFGHASFHFPSEKVHEVLLQRKMKAMAMEFLGAAGDTSGSLLEFFQKNGLDEELTDDLITELRKVDGKPLKLSVDKSWFDQLAIEEIMVEVEKQEKEFQTRLRSGREVMKANTSVKTGVVIEKLKKLLETLLRNPAHGLHFTRALLEEMRDRITLFSNILQDEIELKYARWRKNSFVNQKKMKLEELLGGFLSFLFKKGEIHNALDEVLSELSRFVDCDVEIASREAGIEVYRQLNLEIAAQLKTLTQFEERLGQIRKESDARVNQLLDPRITSSSISEIEVLATPSVLDRLYSSIPFEDRNLLLLIEKKTGSFLKILTLPIEELQKHLKEMLSSVIHEDFPLKLEQLADSFNLFAQRNHQLMDAAAPCWQYSKVLLPSGFDASEIIVVSIPEKLKELFRRNCSETGKIVFADAIDADRIQVFRFKHGLPATSLKKVQGSYKTSYGLAEQRGMRLHLFPAAHNSQV